MHHDFTEHTTSFADLFESRLAQVETALENGDYEAVLKYGLSYLEALPSAPDYPSGQTALHQHFRVFAQSMMQNNHDYASVSALLRAKDLFADYLGGFFVAMDKKGVIIPAPSATKEDAESVWYLCKAMHVLALTHLK
jgi:hypothetical protein